MKELLKRILPVFLLLTCCFCSFQALAQRVDEKVKKDTSVRRFVLQEGRYVGGNMQAKERQKEADKSAKVMRAQKKENQNERIELFDGTDIGVGAAYRIGARKEMNSEKKHKAVLSDPSNRKDKKETKGDSLGQKRFHLEDGKFVGVGEGRKKAKKQ